LLLASASNLCPVRISKGGTRRGNRGGKREKGGGKSAAYAAATGETKVVLFYESE
jgi:hypothetical protein